MPPQRTRTLNEDSKSEASSTRDKYSGPFPSSSMPKNRRTVPSTSATASGLKEVTNASQSTEDAPKINWSTLDRSLLLEYKTAHRLDAPSAFTSLYNERMLTRPGIGRFSPTMAREKANQRVSKDQLVTAVRKDFNAAMISESETITSFLYAVHNQDKTFRMRFEPAVGR